MMKKIAGIIFAISFAATPLLAGAEQDTAGLIEQLRRQINELQIKIQSLRGPGQTPIGIPPFPHVQPIKKPVSEFLPPITITPPIFDNDTGDDDVIQINNLRIQSISGTEFPAIITATNDFGVQCLHYETQESLRGNSFPCPVPRSVLYQIRVDSDTRLLLRNRARATLSDFSVGDRMNVFGFIDRDTQTIDALIIRNLDKPSYRQFIQLNNIEVASSPDRDVPPASFTVVQSRPTPCLDFGSTGTGGVVFPCPLGQEQLERPDDTNAFAPERGGDVRCMAIGMCPPSPIRYYPLAKRYVIEVTSDTQILDRERRPLTLRDIAMGDYLNIYGTLKVPQTGVFTGVIEARVIRNLSKPAQEARGGLEVVIYDGTITCLEGDYQHPLVPCGIIYSATVRLFGVNGQLISTQHTGRGRAFFEHIPIGAYTVTVATLGYKEVKESVSITQAGGIQTITIAMLKSEEPSASLRVISPNGGEVWQKGTIQRIRWEADRRIASVNIKIMTPPGAVCLAIGCPPAPPPSVPVWVVRDASNTGTFEWTIPKDIKEGGYLLTISNAANVSEVDFSDGTFQITGRDE